MILARMNHASQAFGVADPELPIEAPAGVESPEGWVRILEVEGARLLRYHRPVTAVVAEVDGLQRLVDRLGEEPVRRLLLVVGDVFRREARASDWVASTAPGRFAVLLTETDESNAACLADRVRRVCEPWLASAAVPLGLAMGWSSVPASADLEFAVRRAEERMHSDRRAPGRPVSGAPRQAASPVAFERRRAGSSRVAVTPARPVGQPGTVARTPAGVSPAETGRAVYRDPDRRGAASE